MPVAWRRDAVVVLKTAKLEGDRLTFDVDVLEGDLSGGDGPAALFMRSLRFRRLSRWWLRGRLKLTSGCWVRWSDFA